MSILSSLGEMLVTGAAGKAQEKAARAAYEIYRRAMIEQRRKFPPAKRPAEPREWEDLTQREQESWIAGAGDYLDEKVNG